MKDKNIPSMVRILPMDKSYEFGDMTIAEVQEYFFLEELPHRKDKFGNGKFLYKTSGMKATPDTIVLFQYDSKIIALAELAHIQKFKKPQIGVDSTEGRNGTEYYNGAYYFDPYTIKIFEPMDRDEIRAIWNEGFVDPEGKERPGFNNFGRSKNFLNPLKYPIFYQRLKNIRSPSI